MGNQVTVSSPFYFFHLIILRQTCMHLHTLTFLQVFKDSPLPVFVLPALLVVLLILLGGILALRIASLMGGRTFTTYFFAYAYFYLYMSLFIIHTSTEQWINSAWKNHYQCPWWHLVEGKRIVPWGLKIMRKAARIVD